MNPKDEFINNPEEPGEEIDHWKMFEHDLSNLINLHGIDNILNIPDNLLARYLIGACMDVWPLLNYKHFEEKPPGEVQI